MTKPDLTRAKAAAYRLSQLYGFLHPSKIALEDLAWDRGVTIAEGGLEGSEARLIRKGKRGIIRVRSGFDEPGRRRFGIAHELGHWELHEQSQWLACSAEDLRDYKKSTMEIEANTFASELLMPAIHVRDRCEKSCPSFALALEVAEEFKVSLTAAAIRIVQLTKQECILAASQDRRVSWWISKTDRFGAWLQRGQQLSQGTLAWHAFDGSVSREEVQDVPFDAWFLDRLQNAEVAVSEQAVLLKKHGVVLSILTLGDIDDE